MPPVRKAASPRRKTAQPYAAKTFIGKDCVGALITRSKARIWDAGERALAPYGITLSQWIVLDNLYRDTGMTPAETCHEIGYDPGAMTRLLDKLERGGLIRRVRHPRDRRSVRLELTAVGRALHPKVLAAMVGEMNAFVDGLSVAETRLLESLLQRVLANARKRAADLRSEA